MRELSHNYAYQKSQATPAASSLPIRATAFPSITLLDPHIKLPDDLDAVFPPVFPRRAFPHYGSARKSSFAKRLMLVLSRRFSYRLPACRPALRALRHNVTSNEYDYVHHKAAASCRSGHVLSSPRNASQIVPTLTRFPGE